MLLTVSVTPKEAAEIRAGRRIVLTYPLDEVVIQIKDGILPSSAHKSISGPPIMACPDCGQRYYYPNDGEIRINFCKPCMNSKHRGVLVQEEENKPVKVKAASVTPNHEQLLLSVEDK